MLPEERDEDGSAIPGVEQSTPERLQKLPILGSIVGKFTPQRYEKDLGDLQDRLYALRDQTKAAATSMNAYDQYTRPTSPSARTEELADWNSDVASMVLDLSEIAKEQAQIRYDPTMTSREKRDAIKELMNEKREMLREFLNDPQLRALERGETPVGIP